MMVHMDIRTLHSWNIASENTASLQRELAEQLDVRIPLLRWDLVAGADVSYNRGSNIVYAGVIVFRTADGGIVEKQGAVYETHFPYIPGFLSFREAPALLRALAKLKTEPDVFMFDGQGIAHPRRIGLASHVGLWLDRPSLGCAKSRLCGQHKEPGSAVGSLAPLYHGGEVVGDVVRTKPRVKPVYVSAGHRIDLPSSVRVVLATCRGYRLPEPTRQADLYVNALRRGEEAC
jgi:deoxyribonuclease V